jgi:hypothetical protein
VLYGAVVKKAALTLSLMLSFSIWLILGVQLINVTKANPYSPPVWKYVDPIPGTVPTKLTILSPKNNTVYSSGDLNLTAHVTRPETPNSILPGSMWVLYFLDGNYVEEAGYHEVPLSDLDINTVLHGLSDGSHELMVEAQCFVEPGNYTVFSITSSSRVFFTVVDVTSPVISSFSVENKTYSQDDLPLNFTVNESVSWIGYSLDGQTNVTVPGNFTLTKLASGSHTLTVYANDTSGNMGASETIYFTIAEPFPTALVATASGFSAAVIGLGVLVYFKKRKH